MVFCPKTSYRWSLWNAKSRDSFALPASTNWSHFLAIHISGHVLMCWPVYTSDACIPWNTHVFSRCHSNSELSNICTWQGQKWDHSPRKWSFTFVRISHLTLSCSVKKGSSIKKLLQHLFLTAPECSTCMVMNTFKELWTPLKS